MSWCATTTCCCSRPAPRDPRRRVVGGAGARGRRSLELRARKARSALRHVDEAPRPTSANASLWASTSSGTAAAPSASSFVGRFPHPRRLPGTFTALDTPQHSKLRAGNRRSGPRLTQFRVRGTGDQQRVSGRDRQVDEVAGDGVVDAGAAQCERGVIGGLEREQGRAVDGQHRDRPSKASRGRAGGADHQIGGPRSRARRRGCHPWPAGHPLAARRRPRAAPRREPAWNRNIGQLDGGVGVCGRGDPRRRSQGSPLTVESQDRRGATRGRRPSPRASGGRRRAPLASARRDRATTASS